jgi:adiponectin receptor
MIFSSLIGSIGVILPFFRFFDTKRYRPLRIGLFVAMAFSSIVPLLHLVTVKGLVDSFEFLKPALMGCVMYICGVTVYAKRFPEKFFPGKFDFTGMTSHAIWHIFVCLGIFVSLPIIIRAFINVLYSFIILAHSIFIICVNLMAVCLINSL